MTLHGVADPLINYFSERGSHVFCRDEAEHKNIKETSFAVRRGAINATEKQHCNHFFVIITP